MPFDLDSYRKSLSELTSKGLYIGTSSWKYPGWLGLVYDEQRYLTRSKFSEAKFEKYCLKEYAETYKTVCVDAGYYQFPKVDYLVGMAEQVPEDFKFGFKVTDEITLKKFPSLPRFGSRAGKANANFLNAEAFRERFLGPCDAIRSKVGPLIFEFSTFHKHDFEKGRDFVAVLDQFLGALPHGWEYGVEIRNKNWLQPDYFQMLKSHGIAHVYNSWTKMPPVLEQLELEGEPVANFQVSRFLLKPGRKYADAVKSFQPYTGLQELNADARLAANKILKQAVERKQQAFIYVNNRLEGSAPLTIDGIISGKV